MYEPRILRELQGVFVAGGAVLLLQFGWTMETFWSWMVWPNWSMSNSTSSELQGPTGQPYIQVGISAHPDHHTPACVLGTEARRGLLGSTIDVCKVCPVQGPR